MVSNNALKTPLNKIQQLMSITSEECSELTQVCMKIMRKYDSLKDINEDKYRGLLIEELGHVQCMIDLMVENQVLSKEELDNSSKGKRDRLQLWSDVVK